MRQLKQHIGEFHEFVIVEIEMRQVGESSDLDPKQRAVHTSSGIVSRALLLKLRIRRGLSRKQDIPSIELSMFSFSSRISVFNILDSFTFEQIIEILPWNCGALSDKRNT